MPSRARLTQSDLDARILAEAEAAFGGQDEDSEEDDLMWPQEMFELGVGADEAGQADSSTTSSTEHTTSTTSSTSTTESDNWPDEMLM